MYFLLQCALRPVSVVAPDCVRISEALLLSYGFTEAGTLSWSLGSSIGLPQMSGKIHSKRESKFIGRAKQNLMFALFFFPV